MQATSPNGSESPAENDCSTRPEPPTGPRRLAMLTDTTPHSRRLVPLAAIRPLVRLRAERLVRSDPEFLRRAFEQMRYLVEREPALDPIGLARRHVHEILKRDELRWRPWLTTRMHVRGFELIDALQSSGRGIVLSFLHHGQYGGVAPSIGRGGLAIETAVADWILTEDDPGRQGREVRNHVATVSAADEVTTFGARGSYPAMLETVRAGGIVLIASDQPGSTPMRILGREVLAGSGAARLALESGCPVVPVSAHSRGWRQELHVEKPVEPGEFDSITSIQREIGRRHEPAIRAWPEGYQSPLDRWTPADAADAEEFGFGPPRPRERP